MEKRPTDKSFMLTNYQLRIISSSPVTSNVPDVLTRYRNNLVKAWKKFNTIPKMIIFVPEDDIINSINFDGYGLRQIYEHVVEWLTDEHLKIIQYFKRLAAPKATKGRRCWPFYLWIGASLHAGQDNFAKRLKFNQTLEEASKINKNISMLKPLQQWNQEDPLLFSKLENNLSTVGVAALWNSIDSAVSYFDNKIIPKPSGAKRSQFVSLQKKFTRNQRRAEIPQKNKKVEKSTIRLNTNMEDHQVIGEITGKRMSTIRQGNCPHLRPNKIIT